MNIILFKKRFRLDVRKLTLSNRVSDVTYWNFLYLNFTIPELCVNSVAIKLSCDSHL